jgi:hypothetical protein
MQVTTYGSGNQRCMLFSWAMGLETAEVRCVNAVGNPVDSQYTILYLRPEPQDEALAFAAANAPGSPSYTPDVFTTFNSAEGPITATRVGTGSYSMTFDGFGAEGFGGGHVQVSAFGLAGDVRCGVTNWGAETAFVNCHNKNGAAVDTQYLVLYLRPVGLSVSTGSLVVSGHFDLASDVDAWPDPFPDALTAVSWQSDVDLKGSPFSGSLRVDSTLSNGGSDGPRQCVEVGPGAYRAEAWTLNPTQANPRVSTLLIEYFQGSGCTGAQLPFDAQAAPGVPDIWEQIQLDATAPPGTASIGVRLLAGSNTDPTPSHLFYDEVHLLPEPGQLAMLAAGGAVLAGLERRRRSVRRASKDAIEDRHAPKYRVPAGYPEAPDRPGGPSPRRIAGRSGASARQQVECDDLGLERTS